MEKYAKIRRICWVEYFAVRKMTSVIRGRLNISAPESWQMKNQFALVERKISLRQKKKTNGRRINKDITFANNLFHPSPSEPSSTSSSNDTTWTTLWHMCDTLLCNFSLTPWTSTVEDEEADAKLLSLVNEASSNGDIYPHSQCIFFM